MIFSYFLAVFAKNREILKSAKFSGHENFQTRKFPDAKISGRENLQTRKFPDAKISSYNVVGLLFE